MIHEAKNEAGKVPLSCVEERGRGGKEGGSQDPCAGRALHPSTFAVWWDSDASLGDGWPGTRRRAWSPGPLCWARTYRPSPVLAVGHAPLYVGDAQIFLFIAELGLSLDLFFFLLGHL